MRFAQPEALLFLILLPLLVFLHRRHAEPGIPFSATHLAKPLRRSIPTATISFCLSVSGLLVLTLALAHPQSGHREIAVSASGTDILIAVDIARFIENADADTHPLLRLEDIDQTLCSLVANRPNDRIGLIAARDAPRLLSPPTLDHPWLIQRLKRLLPDTVGRSTSGIGSTIGCATAILDRQDTSRRLVILLTDGAPGTAETIQPLLAAQAARDLGIVVYVIDVGTTRARFAATDTVNLMTGQKGQTPPWTQSPLPEIAVMTGGRFFLANDHAGLIRAYHDIFEAEPIKPSTERFMVRYDLQRYLIAVALGLFLAGMVFRRRCVP